MAKVNRYKKLLSNTLILGIGTFGSKILTVLLMPLYTSFLTKGEYGIVDLLVQAANLLIPLVSLGINSAVLRFGMDGETDRDTVLTTGLVVDWAGFAGFLLFWPLVNSIPKIQGYTGWIYLFVFCSITRYLFAYFVKSLQKVRLFTIANVINTTLTLLFDVLFLAVWKIGIIGYILAIVLSDAICIFILFFAAKLYRHIHLNKISKQATAAMLKYSVPLIPATALWWITDVSDRYMVTWMIDEAANGLYAISYKIPNLLIIISGIFMDAWQISILTEKSSLERQRFFSKVLSMYQSLLFVCGGGLILTAKLVTRILVAEEFYDSWQYMPTLVVAMVFSCFVTFLGTVYTVEKRSGSTLVTTVIGTVVNVIGNFFLIRRFGVHGAAISTALSYGLVFVIRGFHTRRFIPIRWDLPRFVANCILMVAQAVIMIWELPLWVLWECLLFAVLLFINLRPLWGSVKAILDRKKGA